MDVTMPVAMLMAIVIAITFVVGVATMLFSVALRDLVAASNYLAEELHTRISSCLVVAWRGWPWSRPIMLTRCGCTYQPARQHAGRRGVSGSVRAFRLNQTWQTKHQQHV